MSATALAFASPSEPVELTHLRRMVAARLTVDGHSSAPLDGICLYRFSHTTTFKKAPAFGVTLGVVLQGRKQVRLGDHLLHVDPQHLIVITRETEYESAASEASSEHPYIGLSLCFSHEIVARALITLAEAGGETITETVPAFVTPTQLPVLAALARIVASLDDPLERRVLAPLALEEILFRLLRSDAAAAVRNAVGREADGVRILDAMQFIRANTHRTLSVAELARRFGMSASHFAHRFRAIARVSPMRYAREVRLEQARSLLVLPGARAGDVAVRVGFESASHFTREFKRRFGAAPTQYQRRLLPAEVPTEGAASG